MPLRINSESRSYPHTRQEILEVEEPELWTRAKETVDKMICLQNAEIALPEGPLYRIHLISLYKFFEELNREIDVLCKELAEKHNENDREGIREAKTRLVHILDVFDDIPWNNLIWDRLTGPWRLSHLKERFRERMDWVVLPNWSFRDIVGTIMDQGLADDLLDSVATAEIPTEASIKPLLSEDHEMLRVY